MLQPKICVDIDSTNKSMFSQIYAGIGGFDGCGVRPKRAGRMVGAVGSRPSAVRADQSHRRSFGLAAGATPANGGGFCRFRQPGADVG